MDVSVKFGDSMSNRSRKLEIYDCLNLLQTTTTTPADGPYDNTAKRRYKTPNGVLP